jgi:phospholipid/cholesterol/gamma-HCH transport system permease protein
LQLIASHQSLVKKYQKKRDRHLDETFHNRWFQRFLVTLFLGGQVLLRILQGKIDRRKIMEHLVTVGLDSLRSVLLIARELLRFGAVGAVGGAFAVAFCRELAPVLTGGVVAGQVGSAFAAEIGEMQVTEQIDALYMLRTNPVDYLVVPRVIACCVMLPILTIFSVAVGILGGLLVATYFYELEPSVFLESVRTFLGPWDLITVAIKSVIFGLIIALVGCGWGLTTAGGGKGVGQAATAAVVTSWVFIFVADFFLSLLMFHELGITRSGG